jgi:plastocyanin
VWKAHFSRIIIITVMITLIFILYESTDNKFMNIINEIYAQAQDENQQKPIEVVIPRGAANPEVDITNLSPRQWYMPKQVSIRQGDSVTWVNKDIEPHTVTSGMGAGIESLLSNRQGTSNGIFNSGLFGPGDSWSYNFTEPGRYTYFCTIHPWMEGVVTVERGIAQQQQVEIPSYPVNASGSRIDRFPIYEFTNDDKYEIGLSWSPNAIVVGVPVNFILTSFDWPSNVKSHLVPYDFVIIRNGTETDKISDLIEVGADAQEVVFDEPGPVRIRIENIGNTPAYAEFNTLVYNNPNETQEQEVSATETGIISNQPNVSRFLSPLTLVYVTYAVIAGIPAAVAVIVILYRKGKI